MRGIGVAVIINRCGSSSPLVSLRLPSRSTITDISLWRISAAVSGRTPSCAAPAGAPGQFAAWTRFMRGEPRTKVLLTIFRKDENRTFPVSITREEIRTQSVRSKVLEPGYAWIRLSQFQERTVEDFVTKLEQIYKQEPKLKGPPAIQTVVANNGTPEVSIPIKITGVNIWITAQLEFLKIVAVVIDMIPKMRIGGK